MKPERSKTGEGELRGLLERRGLRVTSQRLAVLRGLSGAKGPVSHGELADELVGIGMDRATVYRNLMVLAGAKLVQRTLISDGVFRFELVREERRSHELHPHMLCIECGQVRCLPRHSVSVRPGLGEVVDVQLRGRCPACLQG
jgi:Fur family ferric uptake transcriptional regulator